MFAKKESKSWLEKNGAIMVIILMSVTIVAGLVLVSRNQDIRDEAAGKKPGSGIQQGGVGSGGGKKPGSDVQQQDSVRQTKKPRSSNQQ